MTKDLKRTYKVWEVYVWEIPHGCREGEEHNRHQVSVCQEGILRKGGPRKFPDKIHFVRKGQSMVEE